MVVDVDLIEPATAWLTALSSDSWGGGKINSQSHGTLTPVTYTKCVVTYTKCVVTWTKHVVTCHKCVMTYANGLESSLSVMVPENAPGNYFR